MNTFPKWFITALVLTGSVIGIYFYIPPHHVCDSQLEVFRESQQGLLYPKKIKSVPVAAAISGAITTCKLSNGPGGCYDFFQILKKIVKDTKTSLSECASYFAEELIIRSSIQQGIELLALMAWGEKPPERGVTRFGWLQSSDILLFCEIKSLFIQMYGRDEYEALRSLISNKFPAEPKTYENGECTNCSELKMATETMPHDEVWARSLFSTRCD